MLVSSIGYLDGKSKTYNQENNLTNQPTKINTAEGFGQYNKGSREDNAGFSGLMKTVLRKIKSTFSPNSANKDSSKYLSLVG